MSKPVFSDLFAIFGRRNRKSYNWISLFLHIAACVLFFGFVVARMAIYGSFDTVKPIAPLYSYFLLIGFPFSYVYLLVSGQRFRDFGWTGASVLLALIPVIGPAFIAMLWFRPGTSGPNHYGADPLGRAAPAVTKA